MHWFVQTPSMGIPGLTGGQVPGFSAKAKGHDLRPAGPGMRGRAGPGCRGGGSPVPDGSSPTLQLCPLALPPARRDGDILGRPHGVVLPRSPPAQPSTQGWPVQDTQLRHAAPMAASAPLPPTAAADSPGHALVAWGLSSGLGGGRVPPQQPVPWLPGALPCCPTACHQLWAPGSAHAVLCCGTAGPALSSQAAMEVPAPAFHIHVFVAGDPKSRAHPPAGLARWTCSAVGLCSAQGQG